MVALFGLVACVHFDASFIWYFAGFVRLLIES